MSPHVPCLLGNWLLDQDDMADQLGCAARMYGQARYTEDGVNKVRAETDWYILQLIHQVDEL